MEGRLRRAWRAVMEAWSAPIAPGGARSITEPARYREAVGVTIDDDEDQWRRLTGQSNRDLSPLTHQRMRELAFYLWQTNLLANRLIELPTAYLLAEGVQLTAKDPEAQKWLSAFWRDPINNMDIKLVKKVRELALFGEQCWPVFVNEASGHVRLGYLDPDLIETVVMDPDNAEQPIGIVTVKNRKGVARRYRIIVNGPEEVFAARAREIRETFADGECFYYRVNELSNSRRGYSDILAAVDWCDGYEQFLFGEMERANFLRAFIWDVTLKGATPEEVEARARKITVPKPGSMRVHNDSEEWNAVAPDLKAQESAENARLFRTHVLGGRTIPEHWYGAGGDVNRAVGAEMGQPAVKVLTMRQTTLKHILEEVGTFVVWRRLDPTGRQPFDPEALDDDIRPAANFPDLTARDTAANAQAFQQVVVAGAAAVDRGLLSEETATAIIAIVAGQLGVEIAPAAELEKAREESAKRAEADVFAEPPEDAPEGAHSNDAGNAGGPEAQG